MKFVKNIILFLVALIFLFALPKNLNAQAGVPILMYHYVRDYPYKNDPNGITLSVSLSNFDAQMAYLKQNGYTPISLDTLYGIYNHQTQSPPKPVVLTFDDGYIDFYANAYPILKKYNFPAVSFVITGFVDKPGFLSWSNITEMQSSGLISFGAHTVNHAYLSKLSYQNMLNEMKQSKEALQAHLGRNTNFIAYPFGAANGTVYAAAQKLGFAGGIGTWFGKAWGPSMNMPRIRVNGQFTLQTFASRL